VAVELTEERLDPRRDPFDVVIQFDPEASTSLVAKKLGTPMRHRLLAAPAYLKERGTPAQPGDLARHMCIGMGTKRGPIRWEMGHRRTMVYPQSTANSWAICRDLALAGCGIAKIPDYLGAEPLAEGSLVEVLADYSLPREQMHAVYARNRHAPARLRAFVDMLRSHLSEWPSCLLRSSAAPARLRRQGAP
jgi:DNA-binding transcriptional LysR family regulator